MEAREQEQSKREVRHHWGGARGRGVGRQAGERAHSLWMAWRVGVSSRRTSRREQESKRSHDDGAPGNRRRSKEAAPRGDDSGAHR